MLSQKWLEVHVTPSTSSEANFDQFLLRMAYHNPLSVTILLPLIHSGKWNSPHYYHPSTNGLAEQAVQTFKQGIKRISEATLESKLSKFLFQYRITPHSVTGISPAQLCWVGPQGHV